MSDDERRTDRVSTDTPSESQSNASDATVNTRPTPDGVVDSGSSGDDDSPADGASASADAASTSADAASVSADAASTSADAASASADAASASADATGTSADTAGTDDELDADAAELAVQVELLAEENTRLRREYARAHQSKHTRASIGLGALGLLSLGAAALFPAAQTVLLALGGTGLFVSVLTYYLTPERFVSATVGERIYEAAATNHLTLASELGLQETQLYVPLDDRPTEGDVRLFVPQHVDYRVPPSSELQSLLVVPDDERARGIALRPTGGSLFSEFQSTTVDDVSEVPAVLATQLADALVESLEIAGSTTLEVDPDGGRVSVAITDSAYGPVDRFDHPIVSFLGTGLAIGLATPIEVSVSDGDERADAVVTCTWSPGNAS